MATYPVKDDDERQEKLRDNTSHHPRTKSKDEVDSMHPDSWAGGSIVPSAKEVARGEKPANQERGDSFPPPADFEDDPDVTRPWAPRNPDEEDVDYDHAGRVRNPMAEGAPRDAPSTESPQRGDPGGDRPAITR
ncbi:MAG TPA: hypothetical protein VF155_12905 [Candidatus Dormibacteraeota bacterium]